MKNNTRFTSRTNSAEVAIRKFFLRELVIFFMERRRKVIGDADFNFTLKDFNQYLNKERKTSIGININQMKENLEHLELFKKRGSNLEIINPAEPLLKRGKSGRKFKIKKCSTESLNNCLRFIDISIFLRERPEEYKEKSLFTITQDHKIKFLDSVSSESLVNKEYAIFNNLRRNFGKETNYEQLFSAVKAQLSADASQLRRYSSASEKKNYINNGITELRNKMKEISGNPHAIETLAGRMSAYKLVY